MYPISLETYDLSSYFIEKTKSFTSPHYHIYSPISVYTYIFCFLSWYCRPGDIKLMHRALEHTNTHSAVYCQFLLFRSCNKNHMAHKHRIFTIRPFTEEVCWSLGQIHFVLAKANPSTRSHPFSLLKGSASVFLPSLIFSFVNRFPPKINILWLCPP